MRISDWSSDVCSSDLVEPDCDRVLGGRGPRQAALAPEREALAQRVVDFAVGAGAAPGLVRIEATESNRGRRVGQGARRQDPCLGGLDRKRVVSGTSVSVRVDHGGRRNMKQKTSTNNKRKQHKKR